MFHRFLFLCSVIFIFLTKADHIKESELLEKKVYDAQLPSINATLFVFNHMKNLESEVENIRNTYKDFVKSVFNISLLSSEEKIVDTTQDPVVGIKLNNEKIYLTGNEASFYVRIKIPVKRKWLGLISDEHYCGGFLISDKYILTAAHCLNGNIGPMTVYFSDKTKLQEPELNYECQEYISTNEKKYEDDICIVILKQSRDITPLKIGCQQYVSNKVVTTDSDVNFSSRTFQNFLMSAKLRIKEDDSKEKYCDNTRGILCFSFFSPGEQKIMGGDSGSPVINYRSVKNGEEDGRAVGVLSHVVEKRHRNQNNPQKSEETYGIAFTSIGENVEFIRRVTKNTVPILDCEENV